jgi:hypothetical protein
MKAGTAILIATGGTNQGITWSGVSVIEISGAEVASFGQTSVFSDDCGVNEKNCKTQANRISVKVGKTPAFYREILIGGASGAYRKSGVLTPPSLDKDETKYELLK